ncbi:hypothetical protein [Kingella oralis]|jgi:hypothetical protein
MVKATLKANHNVVNPFSGCLILQTKGSLKTSEASFSKAKTCI